MANRIFAGPAGSYPSKAAPLVAGAEIGMGYLVERQTDATEYNLSTAAATVLEQEFLVTADEGETSGLGVVDTYAAGETIEPIQPTSGQLVWLRFATGNNVTQKGMPVTSAGAAGRFALAAAGEKVFAHTEQVINVTANDTLVLCRKP